jgi:hypothetical protein
MRNEYLFTNFGELYRAAFAEVNPTTKQMLLAEVKKALDHWHETAREEVPSASEREILYPRMSHAA